MARLIQAIQIAYEKISFQKKVKSDWMENILKKIDTANDSIKIITKSNEKPLSKGEELSRARKIMRGLGLIVDRKDDRVKRLVYYPKEPQFMKGSSIYTKR